MQMKGKRDGQKNPAPTKSQEPDSNERRKWCLLELNQGHMDFQSIALPPELRHLVAFIKECMSFLFASAKVALFLETHKFFPINLSQFRKKDVPLHSQTGNKGFCPVFYLCNRDVAQLVAHYVRDVGVASSSPVIPTEGDNRSNSVVAFLFAFQ